VEKKDEAARKENVGNLALLAFVSSTDKERGSPGEVAGFKRSNLREKDKRFPVPPILLGEQRLSPSRREKRVTSISQYHSGKRKKKEKFKGKIGKEASASLWGVTPLPLSLKRGKGAVDLSARGSKGRTPRKAHLLPSQAYSLCQKKSSTFNARQTSGKRKKNDPGETKKPAFSFTEETHEDVETKRERKNPQQSMGKR